MQGSRLHRTGSAGPRLSALLIAALMPLAPTLAHAANANGDTAYVDGAAGRALADPARADGGGPPPSAAAPMAPPANMAADMQLAQQIAAQQAQMAQQQQGPGTGPGQQPPFATPAQQIGAGMMQDAASVLDANLQRQVYGQQGPVYYAYPGAAPLPDDLAPPAPGGP